MKDWKILFLFLAFSLFGFTSCENDDADEYAGWRRENDAYIDSIATVVRNSTDGTWKRFLTTGLDKSKEWGNEYYVYCKVLESGDGTEHPASTDYVCVNYKGRLKNGYIFDGSYAGELEPEFDVPATLHLSEMIEGFSLALQQMADGDRWCIYIPYYLAYGVHAQSGIPPYSTLIFDVDLVSFYSESIN